jgi:hypothetical protein
MTLLSTGEVGIGTVSPTDELEVFGTTDVATKIYAQGARVDNNTPSPRLYMFKDLSSGTVTANDVASAILINSDDASKNLGNSHQILFQTSGVTAGAVTTDILFQTVNNTSIGTLSTAMAIQGNEVGIGTASPSSLLHLVGYTSTAESVVSPGLPTAVSNALTITGGAGRDNSYVSGGGTAIGGTGSNIVANGGTGGIATSAALSNATGGVGGGFTFTGGTGGAQILTQNSTHIGGAGGNLEFIGGTGGAASGASGTNTGGVGGDIILVGGTAGSGGSPANGDVLLGITSGGTSRGYVGVGTLSPDVKLHLKGASPIFKIEDTNDQPTIYLEDSGSAIRGEIRVGGGGGDNDEDSLILTASNDNIIFQTKTSYGESMRIDGSGNVGIGTVAPSGPLNVVFETGTGSAG